MKRVNSPRTHNQSKCIGTPKHRCKIYEAEAHQTEEKMYNYSWRVYDLSQQLLD
jgi:hypothetical protein